MVRVKDTTNNNFVELSDPHYFDTNFPNVENETWDEPMYGTIKNMELWLSAPANAAYTLELEYERSGADNTTTDFSWLPEIERWRCIDFAIGEAFESLHMWDIADRFKQKWAVGLGKAIKADSRRKWRSQNYRARSFLEKPTGEPLPASTSVGDLITFGNDYLTF
jgi:hypothetical protein